MNKKELIQNLKTNILDISSIVNNIENSSQIYPIDIDLALSKVRNLYELLLKLNLQATYIPENQEKEISTPIKQPEKKKGSPKQQEQELAPKIKEQEEKRPTLPAGGAVDEEVKEEPQPKHEPEFIIEKAAEKEEVFEQEQPEKKEIKPSKNSPEIVADKFQSKKFVHDDIAKKNVKKDVSTKMQSKPINDINSAIGLNDKFIFIRELFGNNKDQYHETIQILNNFDTYENAVNFLNENFDWDPEDSNFERLKELVRRKYSAK